MTAGSHLGGGDGEGGDEVLLVGGDVQRGGQPADTQQVLGQRSAQGEHPGEETRLTWNHRRWIEGEE